MLSDGFIETLRRVVAGAKVSARQIVLEVTERNELPDLKRAAAVVKELRELGFRVAMDDVGVGHSGLSQMKGLGANTIKIDKFFVDTITEDGSAATIVEMLVRLARDLHMTVIAEGIETVEQVQALIACGVEEGQGYLVSPPLPFAKFDELVEIQPIKSVCRGDSSAGRAGRIVRHFIIWPRSSPPGLAAVWMFAYHLPASRSAAWVSVSVAVPSMGLCTVLNGSTIPAFLPGSLGP